MKSPRLRAISSVLAIVAVLFSIAAHSMKATSVSGYVACLSEEWLDDIMDFVGAEDKASFNAYIGSNKCVVLKDGLVVTVTDAPGILGTRAEFVYKGLKFWAVREALTDYRN